VSGFVAATTPEMVPSALTERFNAGDVDAMIDAYAEGVVLVTVDGNAIGDREQIEEALRAFMGFGVPMSLKVRHMYVSGDIAQYVADWEMRGTSKDGRNVHLRGTACDVARRCDDGIWRYVIDNPYGTRFRERS
jgi:ketosteroid isomerase-like protein